MTDALLASVLRKFIQSDEAGQYIDAETTDVCLDGYVIVTEEELAAVQAEIRKAKSDE